MAKRVVRKGKSVQTQYTSYVPGGEGLARTQARQTTALKGSNRQRDNLRRRRKTTMANQEDEW